MASFFDVGFGSTVAEKGLPVAVAVASPSSGVIGAVVKLDGRASTSPDGGALTYRWEFLSVPIGSMTASEGFRLVEDDGGLVTFSPDKVGEYTARLTVSNGTDESTTVVRSSIRAILVPDGRGIVPDGKFVWSFIRDVWQQVEDREVFETLWSALIQISGAELLKAYQVDFNKSIRDIQDLFQRRWLSYQPRFEMVEEDLTYILGKELAGVGASTGPLGGFAKAIVLSNSELLVVRGTVLPSVRGRLEILYSEAPENVGKYEVAGASASGTGYRLTTLLPNATSDKISSATTVVFGFRSLQWEVTSATPPHVGDYIQIPTGVSSGFYRIVSIVGTTVMVDKAPAGSSSGTTASLHRPVGIQVSPPAQVTTNLVLLPYTPSMEVSALSAGRVLVVGGQSFTISRATVDMKQDPPVVAVTVLEQEVTPGLTGLPWRLASTVASSSQDFEALGVSPGDLLLVDVINDASSSSVEVRAQIVGVSGSRFSFVPTVEPLTPGVVPSVPSTTTYEVLQALGIPYSTMSADGTLVLEGDAKLVVDAVSTQLFARTYFNKERTPTTPFEVEGGLFYLKPKAVIRNRKIPVDETLRSVPTLQEWIVQPETVEENGSIYQVRGERRFLLKNAPVGLIENNDYVIDGQVAYAGPMTFRPGSNVIKADGMDFVDRNVAPGDVLVLNSPPTLAAEYRITAVRSDGSLVLATTIPSYQTSTVTSDVVLRRRKGGTFLRIVPNGFTAKKPIPERLWAEVSYFDNRDAIESNFGILVGLSKADLEAVSSSINYRQAVAGLMYAYTRGSSLSRLRLGAQILLGLPFSEHRGVIRSIEEDYRLGPDGAPVLGRILVEDTDADGLSLGTLRVYTYPIDVTSELAGIETNPATGKAYAVGDSVDLFVALAKGVEILDYISKPLAADSPARSLLQQFHSFRLRANDNIFSLSEVALVSSFLKKITPSYVAFILQSASEFADSVAVRDSISLSIGNTAQAVADNPCFGLTSALMYDQSNFSGRKGVFWDEGLFQVFRGGEDLSTTAGSATVSIPSGGLLAPGFGEGPVVRAGDILHVLSGTAMGKYPIVGVGAASLDLSAPFPTTGTALSFSILHPVSAELRRGQASTTNEPSLGVAVVEGGLVRDGVSPGDLFVYDDGLEVVRHTVVEVRSSFVGGVQTWDTVAVTPRFGLTGPGNYRIYREALLEAPYHEAGVIESDGTSYTAVDPYLLALADSQDEFEVSSLSDDLEVTASDGSLVTTDGTSGSIVTIYRPTAFSRLFIVTPSTKDIRPVLPYGQYRIRLCKKGHLPNPISFDHYARFAPYDRVGLTLSNLRKYIPASDGTTELLPSPWLPLGTSGDRAFCTAGDASLGFSAGLGVLPGDTLRLLNGTNANVDHGHGAGVYPIVGVGSGTLTLAYPLQATEAADWELFRGR